MHLQLPWVPWPGAEATCKVTPPVAASSASSAARSGRARGRRAWRWGRTHDRRRRRRAGRPRPRGAARRPAASRTTYRSTVPSRRTCAAAMAAPVRRVVALRVGVHQPVPGCVHVDAAPVVAPRCALAVLAEGADRDHPRERRRPVLPPVPFVAGRRQDQHLVEVLDQAVVEGGQGHRRPTASRGPGKVHHQDVGHRDGVGALVGDELLPQQISEITLKTAPIASVPARFRCGPPGPLTTCTSVFQPYAPLKGEDQGGEIGI